MAQRSSEQLAAITIDAKNIQYSNSAQQFGVRSMARTEFISISKQELRGGLRRVREFISRTATYLRPAVQLVGALLVGRAPLVFKLAARNLLHDRLRFAATITGIVLSMVLVT